MEQLKQAPKAGPNLMLLVLMRVIGIGIETADMLVKEILSRNLRDRRAVALRRAHGLARRKREPAPRKGLARSGNARVRKGMIQLAWRFLQFQKESTLAKWFEARTKNAHLAQEDDRRPGPQAAHRLVAPRARRRRARGPLDKIRPIEATRPAPMVPTHSTFVPASDVSALSKTADDKPPAPFVSSTVSRFPRTRAGRPNAARCTLSTRITECPIPLLRRPTGVLPQFTIALSNSSKAPRRLLAARRCSVQPGSWPSPRPRSHLQTNRILP